jgi:phosphatidyl-myo-inositol alpha-mannosyltransferase
MKIALVTPYSWTTPGGVNVHIAHLATHLRLRGHEVRIIAPADGPVEPGVIAVGRTLGVPYNGSVARLAFGPRVAGRVRVALRRSKPDVIHVHEPFAPSVSLLATMAAKAPLVSTFHVAAEDPRAYRAARIPLEPLWRKIDIKIAVSVAARDTVEGVFGPGARVIGNGVEMAAYRSVQPPDPPPNTVLYFGRLEKRKGPQVLIEALPALAAAVPGIEVVIAGEGALLEELQAGVPDDLKTQVRFTGRFDESDRIGLLASAGVVTLPALGGESFGITLLEAMAAGRPIVATSIAGYAAVARDGTDARLVPPGDAAALAEAVAGLLRDPPQAARLGAAARQRASGFDWTVITDEIESVYREALSPSTRRRREVRRAGGPA